MTSDVFFLVLLPLVAFLYASVGHGGASGYLALMALFSFPADEMRPTALMLNVLISGIAFYHFWKAGYFRSKLFFVFVLGSFPLAILGGMIDVDPRIYKIILGVSLLIAIVKMLDLIGKRNDALRPVHWGVGIGIGAVIGFLSGLIGIGGGIILSPVILLLRWGTVKEAAAVSALFIFVNSLGGLGGQLINGLQFTSDIYLHIGLAAVGGYLGAYFGSNKLNTKAMRNVLALVLLFASIKLLFV